MTNASDVIVLTGNSGTGKTHLINNMRSHFGARLYLVDGLLTDSAFVPPEPDTIDFVAVDHVSQLRDAVATCTAALGWASLHRKLLILVEQSLTDFEHLRIALPVGYAGMELHGSAGADGITLTRDGTRRHVQKGEFSSEMVRLQAS